MPGTLRFGGGYFGEQFRVLGSSIGIGAAVCNRVTCSGSGVSLKVGHLPIGIVPPAGEHWVPQFGFRFPEVQGSGDIRIKWLQARGIGRSTQLKTFFKPRRISVKGRGKPTVSTLQAHGQGAQSFERLDEEELLILME